MSNSCPLSPVESLRGNVRTFRQTWLFCFCYVSVVQAGHHRAQQIDRQSALQTSQKDNNEFYSSSQPRSKIHHSKNDTARIFSQPALISFKRDKHIGNFFLRSAFQSSDQPGTFKCARARWKTCSFIRNVEKMSGPKRFIRITDHFTCTSANVIFCITCTLCKQLYIDETGRRLGDRFRQHLHLISIHFKIARKATVSKLK